MLVPAFTGLCALLEPRSARHHYRHHPAPRALICARRAGEHRIPEHGPAAAHGARRPGPRRPGVARIARGRRCLCQRLADAVPGRPVGHSVVRPAVTETTWPWAQPTWPGTGGTPARTNSRPCGAPNAVLSPSCPHRKAQERMAQWGARRCDKPQRPRSPPRAGFCACSHPTTKRHPDHRNNCQLAPQTLPHQLSF